MLTTFQVIELPVKHPELFEALGIAQPKVLRAAAVSDPRVSCFMGPLELARLCLPVLLPITPTAVLFVCRGLSWFKSTLVKVLAWCVSCL